MGRRQPEIGLSGKIRGVVAGAAALVCVLAMAGSSGIAQQAHADALDGAVTDQNCYYADAGAGPDASGLCWLDWTYFNIPMLDDMTQASLDAAPTQQFSLSIPGGYTMTYTVKYTPIYDGYPGNGTVAAHATYQLGDTINRGVEPMTLPTWVNSSGATVSTSSKGSAFGASQYTGIAGMPALYAPAPLLGTDDWPIKDKAGNPSSAGGDVLANYAGDPTAVVGLLPATGWTVTLSDITMTDAAGKPVTGWSLTAADAESTNQGESLTFASNSASPWQITNWIPPRYYAGVLPDTTGALFSSINVDACGGPNGWAPQGAGQHTYGNNFTYDAYLTANPDAKWGGVTSGASGSTQWLTCTGVPANIGSLMASTVSPTSLSVTAYEELENGAMGELSGEQAFALAVNTSQVVLTKDVAGRAAPGDQFGLSIADGPGTTLAAATTSGTDDSATTVPAGLTDPGPVTVLAGVPYTLSESDQAGASLSNYSQSWSCSNSTTPWDTGSTYTAFSNPNLPQAAAVNASISGGTLPIGTLPVTQMPDGATGTSEVGTPLTGDSIACTLTNTPLPPQPTGGETPSDPPTPPVSDPSPAANTGGSVITPAASGAVVAGLLILSGLALAVVRFGRKRA